MHELQPSAEGWQPSAARRPRCPRGCGPTAWRPRVQAAWARGVTGDGVGFVAGERRLHGGVSGPPAAGCGCGAEERGGSAALAA
jgi:hypothetical protein